MVKSAAFLSALLPLAIAYPWAMEASQAMDVGGNHEKRQAQEPAGQGVVPPDREPLFVSGRSNSGISSPDPPFNAEDQHVNVARGSGHEYRAPGPQDLRGQCPGLNAGELLQYIEHSGKVC